MMGDDFTIGFDADDTLWHNETIFENVHLRYRTLLARFHDAGTVEQRLFATEMRNLKRYGYGVKGFMLSAIETAIDLSDGRISAEEIRLIIALGQDMLAHPVELLDGVQDVIGPLAHAHRLLLITKGDLRDQERKLSLSGLAGLFRAVEIVSEKDSGTYERILRRHGIPPQRFLMVGNSLKSDILPVLEIGGVAAHVPYHLTWAAERVDRVPDAAGRFFQLRSLRELPDLVREMRAGPGA